MAKRKNTLISIGRKSTKRGRGLLNTLINKLPVELHIPGYRFCGPGTRLQKRLDRGDQGINPLDEACKTHDIAYSQFRDTHTRNIADKELADVASSRLKSPDAKLGEKIAAFGVSNIMNMKTKLGMGLKKRRKSKKRGGNLKVTRRIRAVKNKKTRVIPVPKKGGFLPLLLPLLGALGAVGGGAAGIAKAVNDAKANRQQIAEQKRHNLVIEQAAKGKGLYLGPYKKGFGLHLINIKKPVKKLPHRPLTNIDLKKFTKILQIPYFRGVFMRDKLPKRIRRNECGIVNLDISSGNGTHWTAYVKKKDDIMYFDSFGNLRPPKELIKYFLSDGGLNSVKYNYDIFQKPNSVLCGHLCLTFLYNMML